MAVHRLFFTLLACAALPACQWVDSTGAQARSGNGDDRFAPVISLTEEIPGQLDFTDQLPTGNYSRSWHIAEEGILPACDGAIDPEKTAGSLAEACTETTESCELIILEQPGADTGEARYKLLPPRLSSPIGLHYQWNFENSGVIETYNVTLCINAVNEAPVARDDAYTTHARSTLDMAGPIRDEECKAADLETSQNPLLANDSDDHHHKGSCLIAELLTLPEHASNDFVAGFSNDGGFSYSPSAGGTTTSDSFSYRVYDGEQYSKPATVKIEIRHDDTRPEANYDWFRVNSDSRDNLFDVLRNDSNPLPQRLKLNAIVVPPHNGGSAVIQPDQSILYTPAEFFSGWEYLKYSVENVFGETDSAWIEVYVH